MHIMNFHMQTVTNFIKERFQVADLKSGQYDALLALLTKQDILVDMPTGYGKSLVFQSYALVKKGVVLVVEPFISLLHDQHSEANSLSIPSAIYYGSMTENEKAELMSRVRSRSLRMLFITPERFQDEDFVAFLSEIDISLIVVDEAHYVQSTGHGFRSAYGQLSTHIKKLRDEKPCRLLLSSATIHHNTAKELALECGSEQIRIISLLNPSESNVKIQVIKLTKQQRIHELISSVKRTIKYGAVLVYVSNKVTMAGLHDRLRLRNVDVKVFHGGLEPQTKRDTLLWFKSSEKGVLISTSALSAGFNKPNIRTVIHYQPPRSVEDYLQEIGRAGRDGQTADAIMLYTGSADDELNGALIRSGSPSVEAITAFCSFIANSTPGEHYTLSPMLLQLRYGSTAIPMNALRILLKQCKLATGAIDFLERDGKFEVMVFGQIDIETAKKWLVHTLNSEAKYNDFKAIVLNNSGCKYRAARSYFGKTDVMGPMVNGFCSCCYPDENGAIEKPHVSTAEIRAELNIIAKRLSRRLGLPSFIILNTGAIEHLVANRPKTIAEFFRTPYLNAKVAPLIAADVLEQLL